jgi:methylglyoxal/glyoxal reductase
MKIPDLKLNTGSEIPAIGFGTWQIDDGEPAKQAVLMAIEAGYRLIDTAKLYGNEASVGEAVRQSSLPRKELFVTTKLWTSDFGYKNTLEAFQESKQRLGLEYIDLYLIHWPGTELRDDTWRGMVKIYEKGEAKAVGVSNYDTDHLEHLLATSGLSPAVNQIEFHPFIYDKQAPILEFCKAHDIAVESYSPLARGRQMDNPVITALAKKHGRTNAQVMLRWSVQHSTIPIPKSSHPQRIKENLDIFDFKLSDKEMQALNGLGDSKSSLPFLVRLLK